MTGNWIKIRVDLITDPDVMRLSDILGIDDPTAVGHLVAFWAWVDKQTTDGTGIAITSPRLDRLIGRPGFADAMRQIGWLSGRDGSLFLPRFERHNGNSAKARAMESEAKRLRRLDTKGVSDKLSDICPTKTGQIVGPEKRREDLIKRERERDAGAGETIPPKKLEPTLEKSPPIDSGMRRPTLRDALGVAQTIGVQHDKADEWWHVREASGWQKGMAGGGTSPVGTNWQADLKTYASRGGFSKPTSSSPNGHQKRQLTTQEWEK
jgi:hypothetical protein